MGREERCCFEELLFLGVVKTVVVVAMAGCEDDVGTSFQQEGNLLLLRLVYVYYSTEQGWSLCAIWNTSSSVYASFLGLRKATYEAQSYNRLFINNPGNEPYLI